MRRHHTPVVVVCGVAGVGKTYLIERARPLFEEAGFWRASTIIQEARTTADPDALRGLPSDEMRRSQDLLVHRFHEMRKRFQGDLILLDAHCVIDRDEGFYDIEVDVMRRLSPDAFVHVEDGVDAIAERRRADTNRSRPARSLEQLALYQIRSLQNCERYSDELGIPMFRVQSGNLNGLCAAIDDVRRHIRDV